MHSRISSFPSLVHLDSLCSSLFSSAQGEQTMKLHALVVAGLLLASGIASADKLDDIKKAGVLRVAAFDGNPPFGFIDEASKKIVGFDVDYANELGKKLGVKV